MKDASLIHFFGPDGAGKTTQVDLLVNFFKKRGVQTRKCWVRSPHTLAYILWRLFVKIGFYRIIWNPFGVGIKIPAVDRNRALKNFWSLAEFFSVLPHIAIRKILMSRGYKIIAERYILDTITTIAFFVNDINFIRSRLARVLIRFIPKDAILIFVDADFETILQRREPLFYERIRKQKNPKRKRKKVRIYGYVPNHAIEPREFIDFQRKAYKVLATSLGAFEIYSPNLSVDETFNVILQFLGLDQ
ncbi:MAG: hypothetical protein ACTSV7_09530 [Candidatus Baldrarchaeia archaeon]